MVTLEWIGYALFIVPKHIYEYKLLILILRKYIRKALLHFPILVCTTYSFEQGILHLLILLLIFFKSSIYSKKSFYHMKQTRIYI